MDQAVPNPNGVTTFGSCVVHIEPDFATVDLAVSKTTQRPDEAANHVRQIATTLRGYFPRAGVESVRASRLELLPIQENGKLLGFHAQVRFNLTIKDLERVDAVIVGGLNAGITDVHGVQFRSSRLREARSEARQGAFLASLKRAEQYAEAAGIKLGRVIHIEEVPEEGLQDHLDEFDEFYTSGAHNPSAIAVRAAVRVVFSIKASKMAAATGTFPAFEPLG